MTMNETHFSMAISPPHLDRLRALAKQHGFTIGRGKEKDWGSLAQLLKAVAEGEYVIVPAALVETAGGHHNGVSEGFTPLGVG